MYGDGYLSGESQLSRFMRAVSASFRVGRLFGVEVRVFYLTLLVVPLISVIELAHAGLGWRNVIGLSAALTLGLYLVTYTHEMGHIVAGWRYRIHTPLITISPLGGLAHMGAPAPRPGADIVISLAGPATHLVWLALLAPVYFTRNTLIPPHLWQLSWGVAMLWDLNLALAAFNLLPFYPMDGGRVLSAILSHRMHPNRALTIAAKVGMAGAVLIGIGGLVLEGLWGGIMLWIGITNFMACRQALVIARYQQSPYGGVTLAPWETDPDAWKHGSAPGWQAGSAPPAAGTPGVKKPSWRERRRAQRSRELDEELDRLLAKIHASGLGSLTWREKRTLQRASKEARKR